MLNQTSASHKADARGRAFLAAVVVGLALGFFSILADGIVRWRLITMLGNLASPWGLGAFLVGRRAESTKQGALVGAVTLVIGVFTYYVGLAVRGYVVGELTLAWTAVATVAGPIMGLCGAAVSSMRERPPAVAVAAPSAMLVAESIFFVIDRRVWLYNLRAEPYRLADLALVAAFLIGAIALPLLFVKGRGRRAGAYMIVVSAGVCGALGFVLLSRVMTSL